MTETRTTSSTGGEKGVKPQAYDLVPVQPLAEVAEVYHYGAQKYSPNNWRRGYEWSKSYAAAMRHLTQFWDGEDSDAESGLSHLAHAVFHMFSLLEWRQTHREFDDRPNTCAPLAETQQAIEDAYDWDKLGIFAPTTVSVVSNPTDYAQRDTSAGLSNAQLREWAAKGYKR